MSQTNATGFLHNRFVEAVHDVLLNLELSKSNIESFIDNISDVFGVINEHGVLYKCNKELARILDFGEEDYLKKSFKSLFRQETWELFHDKIYVLKNTHHQKKNIEFELGSDAVTGKESHFVWSISIFRDGKDNLGTLFSVFGRNVTELRGYQRQLSNLFGSIPVGLFQINAAGELTGPYSAFLEVLLGRRFSQGTSLRDLISGPLVPTLNEDQEEGIQAVLDSLGKSSLQYERNRPSFLRKFFIKSSVPASKAGKWVGLNYQPMVYNGTVTGLLIILEDRTEVEDNLQEELAERDEAADITRRLIEIRRALLNGGRSLLQEIVTFSTLADEGLKKKDHTLVWLSLHGIKSLARFARFTLLARRAHILQDKLFIDTAFTLADQADFIIDLKRVLSETKEILALGTMLSVDSIGGILGQPETTAETVTLKRCLDLTEIVTQEIARVSGSKLQLETQVIEGDISLADHLNFQKNLVSLVAKSFAQRRPVLGLDLVVRLTVDSKKQLSLNVNGAELQLTLT